MAAVSVKDRIALFSTRAANDTGPPPTAATPPTPSTNAPAAVPPPWRPPASVASSRFSTPDKDPDHVAEPSTSASSSDDEAAHHAHDAAPPRLPLRRAPPPIAPRPRTPHLTAKIEELALVRPPGVTAVDADAPQVPQLPPPPPYHAPAPSSGGASTSTPRPPLPSKPRPAPRPASVPAPEAPLPPPPLPPRAGRPVMPVPAIPPRIAGPRARSPPSRRRAKTPPPPPPPPMRGGRKPLVTSVSMGHLNAVAGVRRNVVPSVPPVPARPTVVAVTANAEKPVVRMGAVATLVAQATLGQAQTPPPAHPRNPHPVRSPAPARPVAPSPGRQRAGVAAAAVAVNAMVRGRRRSGEKTQVHPATGVNRPAKDPLDALLATVPADARKRYADVYARLAKVGTVDEMVVVALWRLSKLPLETLADVWDTVAPRFGRGWTEREFAGGLWLIDAVLAGRGTVREVVAKAGAA